VVGTQLGFPRPIVWTKATRPASPWQRVLLGCRQYHGRQQGSRAGPAQGRWPGQRGRVAHTLIGRCRPAPLSARYQAYVAVVIAGSSPKLGIGGCGGFGVTARRFGWLGASW